MNGGEAVATSESGPSGASVTLDRLIALNDEMAALVRAGVPLERGLVRAGEDLGGRLGAIVDAVGARLAEGERLPEALERSGHALPRIYRAVVEAGLRSGRLASALEGMADLARGYAEARRAAGMALLYPIMVLSLAYGLFLLFVVQIAPRYAEGFAVLRLPPMRLLDGLTRMGETVAIWGPIAPALMAVLLARWAWSGRSVALDAGPMGGLLGRLPVIGPMIRSFRSAQFAELLALLIDHRVPLDEGIVLAAEASGDRATRRAADALAEGLRRGEGPAAPRGPGSGSIPPLLAWTVTAGRLQGDIPAALRHAAANYRRKAEARAEVLRTALPTLLMLGLGAGAVLLYSLLVFVPMTTLWDEIGTPPSN